MMISKEKVNQYIRNHFIALLLPIIVGFLCGMEAIFMRTIIPFTFKWIMTAVNVYQHLAIPIIFAALLTGSYLTGLLSKRDREISGVGLDFAIKSYHFNAGMMPAKIAPLKFLATLFTLGLGGSGGLVGPTAAIGQGTASYFSRWFKLSDDKSRILALCGIAGSVSGLLHAPFGAAVFALEVCFIRSIVYEDLAPVLLSSVSAYITTARIIRLFPFGHWFQQPHLFRSVVHDTAFPWSLDHLAYCVVVALVTTLLGILFVKTFRVVQKFNEARIERKYASILGALMVGSIALLFFRQRLTDVLGEPSDLVERCATMGGLIAAPIALLIGRWATTFLTIGFGGSGGFFAPTVLMGSLCGIIVGRVLIVDNVRVLVTAGISAALVGIINVPMAAVIIVVEVFGVSFIIPAAIGSTIGFLLAKNWVIYPNVRAYQEYEDS